MGYSILKEEGVFMGSPSPTIETLWSNANFSPNDRQREAILHMESPLYLTSGPGSGKTRVLLWRTLNLMVFHRVAPEEIFLATFTEKAALQLKEGLRHLLGLVTNLTGTTYDLGRMYVGTVHSLCQRMLADRKFSPGRQRRTPVTLMDELSQYIFLTNSRNWGALTENLSIVPEQLNQYINQAFGDRSVSRHHAISNCLAFFNRLSEENLDLPRLLEHMEQNAAIVGTPLATLIRLYERYQILLSGGILKLTDFSLLQQEALALLKSNSHSGSIFRHVIVDEYQDTNTIQERLFFHLAHGSKNLCVVGDDDQALYRFRGATVENFVQFPERCHVVLNIEPHTIPLVTNYRSQSHIVAIYNHFMQGCHWTDSASTYRVSKVIEAYRDTTDLAVVSSTPQPPEAVFDEIARLVVQLIDSGKVKDSNQIAFLFPSLKSEQVKRAKSALENVGLKVYAPRAGRFLEVEEAKDFFGLLIYVFGRLRREGFAGQEYREFHDWLDECQSRGEALFTADPAMKAFLLERRRMLEQAAADYKVLFEVVEGHGWTLDQVYDIDQMKRSLYNAPKLSDIGKKAIVNRNFEAAVQSRQRRGESPFTLDYVLKRATSIDWNLLDLFYRLCGFKHFKAMFDLAEIAQDEGPICNLGLISQYLARFMDEYLPLIPANRLANGSFVRLFFSGYLYALFRRGESEYEDADDPFPRGRIPFLTIHQAKGLEFPVVVLGNLRKDDKGPQPVEKMVRPLINRRGEPLERVSEFDIMRMYYVALSRAKNLLILARPKGRGQRINDAFRRLLDEQSIPRIPEFDFDCVAEAELEDKSLPKNYSFTSDYLVYQKCPRQYMVFNKYGFVASRSQTMFFGSLVHRTLEDLHQYLIAGGGRI